MKGSDILDPLAQNFRAEFEIKIYLDTSGNVAWRLEAAHPSNKNTDVDCKNLISVIEKLNKFTAQLEHIAPIED